MSNESYIIASATAPVEGLVSAAFRLNNATVGKFTDLLVSPVPDSMLDGFNGDPTFKTLALEALMLGTVGVAAMYRRNMSRLKERTVGDGGGADIGNAYYAGRRRTYRLGALMTSLFFVGAAASSANTAEPFSTQETQKVETATIVLGMGEDSLAPIADGEPSVVSVGVNGVLDFAEESGGGVVITAYAAGEGPIQLGSISGKDGAAEVVTLLEGEQQDGPLYDRDNYRTPNIASAVDIISSKPHGMDEVVIFVTGDGSSETSDSISSLAAERTDDSVHVIAPGNTGTKAVVGGREIITEISTDNYVAGVQVHTATSTAAFKDAISEIVGSDIIERKEEPVTRFKQLADISITSFAVLFGLVGFGNITEPKRFIKKIRR